VRDDADVYFYSSDWVALQCYGYSRAQRRAGETSIANLDLSLDSGTTPYKASTSTVDNVEHISYKDLQPDIYLLTVTRNSDTLGGNESYALAFNFAAIPNVI
jgi:hypothetical protein